jgi:hypothetical protein
MIENIEILTQASPNPWKNLNPIEIQKNALSLSIYTNKPKPIEALIIAILPIKMKFFLPNFYRTTLITGEQTNIPTSIIARTKPTIVSVILL